MTAWTCNHCASEQTHDAYCQACDRARYASFEIMLCEHILEHIADARDSGTELDALGVLKLMNARPCYARINGGQGFQLSFIASRMRLLARDTRAEARRIFDAHASRMALNIVQTGDVKDQIAVMKGRQVLGDVVEVRGEQVTRHIVELHEGPPPKRET